MEVIPDAYVYADTAGAGDWSEEARVEEWRTHIVIADGMVWQDADGNEAWPEMEAISLAADLGYRRGYAEVEVTPISLAPDMIG